MRKSRRNNTKRRRGGCGCSTASWFTKGGNCEGVVQLKGLKGGFSKKSRKIKLKKKRKSLKLGGNLAYYNDSINIAKI